MVSLVPTVLSAKARRVSRSAWLSGATFGAAALACHGPRTQRNFSPVRLAMKVVTVAISSAVRFCMATGASAAPTDAWLTVARQWNKPGR